MLFPHLLGCDRSFPGDEFHPWVVPKLCRLRGSYALLISIPSNVLTDTVEDKMCFLFGVKKPALLAPDNLKVVLFAIDIAILVVLLSTSCCDGFMVVARGLSGVTFVSVVDTCWSPVSHHHPLGMEDNNLKKRGSDRQTTVSNSSQFSFDGQVRTKKSCK